MYDKIEIDEVEYDVRIVYGSIKRVATIEQGQNRGRSLYPSIISDVMGTSISYTMQVERKESNPQAYYDFYEAITSPVAYHTVKLPYNDTEIEFDAEILSAQDTDMGLVGGNRKWQGLSITFNPIEPQRMPTL